MPIYKDKKTKRLFIKFDFRGVTYKQRLPETINKTVAEELEIKWKHRLLFESNGIEAQANIYFEDFLKEYFMPFAENNHSKESFDYDARICREALKLWKGKSLRQIKASDIERFKQIRKFTKTQHNRQRKPASLARELAIISKVFSLAVKNDFIEYNPCSRIEKPKFDNVQNKILPIADEEKFLASFESDWARNICILVLNTGLRQNDALKLSKFNIDRERAEIRLLQGKTQRTVIIPMNRIVQTLINTQWSKTSDLLFPSPKTGGIGVTVKKAVMGACIRAKIPVVTIKDLRRSFGTRLDEGNVDATTKARLLGHGDLRSVHRYTRGRSNMREAVENLTNRANFVPLEKEEFKLKAVND